MIIGATAITSVRIRSRTGAPAFVATTTRNTINREPIHTGHVRNEPTPAIAKIADDSIDGCSSHTTTAHHIATAKSSATTCAKNECSVNERKKYSRDTKSSSTAATA